MSFRIVGAVLVSPLHEWLGASYADRPHVDRGFSFEAERDGLSVSYGDRNQLVPWHRVLHVLREAGGAADGPIVDSGGTGLDASLRPVSAGPDAGDGNRQVPVPKDSPRTVKPRVPRKPAK